MLLVAGSPSILVITSLGRSRAAGGLGTVYSPKNGWVTPAGGDDLVRDVLGQIDRYGKPSPM